MLKFRRMLQNVFRHTAILGLAFLTTTPNAPLAASNLRDEAIAYREQGYEAQRVGNTHEALAFYQKAAALDPSYPTPLNDLGVLLEEEGHLEDAEQAYQRALALNPNYLEPHANLGMLYERMGQREKAIYHWIKRYELGDSHDAWTSRAEERLVALGVLTNHPGLKGKLYSRRQVVEGELKANAQSIDDFHASTDKHGPWP